MFWNKKIIKIISFSLIFITIFTFSVVLATDDSVYVWSSETEPLSVQSSANVQANAIMQNNASSQTNTNTQTNANSQANTNT